MEEVSSSILHVIVMYFSWCHSLYSLIYSEIETSETNHYIKLLHCLCV